MDRVPPIGPRPRHWLPVGLDPDREDPQGRRRAAEERERRERERERAREQPPRPDDPDDPPHRVDVRA